MRKLIFLFLMLLAFPTTANAASDVIATYKYSDGSMVTICTRDANHVRMDTSKDSYMLLSDNKIYAVSRTDDDTWTAMDMDKMKSMANGMGSMFGGGEVEYDVRYEKTSKTEKIAGYSGTVYTAVVYEDGKVTSRDEVVLGSHSNLKKLSDGWMAMAKRLTNMAESFSDSIEEAEKMGYGGMLRYGQDMRLSSLKVRNLDNAYYKLPSGTKQAQVPQPPKQTSNNDMGLSDDAKEIGHDAKETTKSEVKDEVRGFIKGLFE